MKFLFFLFFCSTLLFSQETKTTEMEIPYPWAKFVEQEDVEKKIQDFRLELSYQKTPLENVVEEWRQIAGISIQLGSGIFVERSDDSLRLTLTTPEMPFVKALELVMITLDLVYYLDGENLVIDLAGSQPPKDPQEKYWRALQQIRTEAENPSETFITNQKDLRIFWKDQLSKPSTLSPGRHSFPQICVHLAEKDAVVVVPERVLWTQEEIAIGKEPLSLQSLLDRIVQEKEADLFFTEEALYLLPKKGE